MLFRPKRDLTLTSFIPKKGNQYARAAGIQFVGAQRALPGTLIVAGRPGSGKTHLLHALANFAKQRDTIRSISCMSSVQFADEIVQGNFYRDQDEVLQRYAGVDLLAIDDVERLFSLPEVAVALLKLIQMRQTRESPTLLTVTICLASVAPNPLLEFLDHQPAVRLN